MKKYVLAAGIWLLILPLAILNGGLREAVLNKLGSIGLPLSGIILSLCIFGVAYLLIPKLDGCRPWDYLIFGIMWFILTNLFDLSMILTEGGGFGDLLGSYNFFTGNLWILVVLSALLSPVLAAVLRKKI